MHNKSVNCINSDIHTYLLNMYNMENKNKSEDNETNPIVEFGEQDLKEILLKNIKEKYIESYKNNSTTF